MFRRAWLDNVGEEDDDEIDESSRVQRKIISNFKGPLTLHETWTKTTESAERTERWKI